MFIQVFSSDVTQAIQVEPIDKKFKNDVRLTVNKKIMKEPIRLINVPKLSESDIQ